MDAEKVLMFDPIEIPYDSVMLFNTVVLKEGIKVEDVELALGEMCNVVKNTYGNEEGGFIAGQVFEFSGFISDEGSVDAPEQSQDHLVIMTYWKTFEQHEKSHADAVFKEKFSELLEFVENSAELGYKLLWQGEPE